MRRLLFLAVLVLLGGCSSGPQGQELPHHELQRQPIVSGSVLYKTPITPRHLTLPRVKARVLPLSLKGSALIPPSDPRVLGWWGRKAGAHHGTTLLLGHTVHRAAWKTYGHGALDDLEDIKIGTDVNVSGVHYTVVSNKTMSKETLARRADRIFSQTGPPRLVVVTCEGYNKATGHYSSNVVLVAEETV